MFGCGRNGWNWVGVLSPIGTFACFHWVGHFPVSRERLNKKVSGGEMTDAPALRMIACSLSIPLAFLCQSWSFYYMIDGMSILYVYKYFIILLATVYLGHSC